MDVCFAVVYVKEYFVIKVVLFLKYNKNTLLFRCVAVNEKSETTFPVASLVSVSYRCLGLDLLDTGLLTCEGTQVVKFSTTNTTTLVDCDAVDSW